MIIAFLVCLYICISGCIVIYAVNILPPPEEIRIIGPVVLFLLWPFILFAGLMGWLE